MQNEVFQKFVNRTSNPSTFAGIDEFSNGYCLAELIILYKIKVLMQSLPFIIVFFEVVSLSTYITMFCIKDKFYSFDS